MKQKAAVFLSAIYLSASVFSCSSLGRAEEPVQPPPDSGVAAEAESTEPALPDGWTHEKEITHEGSRSEGSISRLFYRYTEVPPVFSRINIAGAEFAYVPMVNIWDNSGFIRGSGFTVETDKTSPLSNQQLKRGWYPVETAVKLAGTPGEWIFVEADKIMAWVAPDHIEAFIAYYSLLKIEGAPRLVLPENAGE